MPKNKKVHKKSWLARRWQKIKHGTSTANPRKKKATAACQNGRVILEERRFR